MKLEKECYIGNVYYTEYRNGKYDLNFNCIISNSLTKDVTLMINIHELTKEEMKIIRKGQVGKLKLTLEAEEPILDEAERKYLSDVIRPFRDDVEFICKNGTNVDSEYINIGYYKNDNTLLPCFKKGSMYKNMELNKKYTLEDLQL